MTLNVMNVSGEPEHTYRKKFSSEWVFGKRSEELYSGMDKGHITKCVKTSFMEPKMCGMESNLDPNLLQNRTENGEPNATRV